MSATDPSLLKRTALAETHARSGGRMVEFGGWWMPVQYASILEEHALVRQKAGLFDISHMGEVVIKGPGAESWLNSLFTNDVTKLVPGAGQYTLMLNEDGGVIDDLILYRLPDARYLAVINASMIEEDVKWMLAHLPESGVDLENASDRSSAVALQGPKAAHIANAFLGEGAKIPGHNCIEAFVYRDGNVTVGGWVARTGYTGEDGFEFFFRTPDSEKVWNGLLKAGEPFGLKPAGLGARDTLRLEAALPLNGNDLSPKRTPLEAGLGIFVSLTKAADFPGKAVLQKQKAEGLKEKLVAFKITGKGAPPRSHYAIYGGGERIGEVTSGSLSPTLGYGIGMGYVKTEWAVPGKEIEIEVRGARLAAVVVKKPFYKRAA